tara:strand:- start:713 stop:1840 length:1128 start_codon:yes stop_codon:yes gene_type:complete
MANNFTASVIPILRAKLDTIFKSKATVNPELTNVPVAATAVLENQTANIVPLYEGAGSACVGVKVLYNVADDTSAATVSATPISSDCALTSGDTMSTAAQDYDFNIFIKEKIQLNDKDCDNFVKFMDRTAFLLGHKMSMIVQGFNTTVINSLEANKSVASAANLPDDVTVVAGNYTLTGAQYWTGQGAADSLAIFDQLARVKGLPNNYYIVSGKSLKVPYDIARDHAANDNERSYSLTFQRREIFWDEDALDTLVGAEVVFLIDPNALVSYFMAEYKEEGEMIGDTLNTTNFKLPLTFFDQYQDASGNMKALQFANDGVLQPVEIDVRYQKNCDATATKYGKPSLTHVWELDMVGLFDLVPAVGDNTGIIRVDKA